MERSGYSIASSDLSKVLKSVDYLGLGRLKYSDFIMATLDRKALLDEECIYEAFKYFDYVIIIQDDLGYITYERLKSALEHAGFNLTDEDV